MASVRIMVSYDGEWVKSPETGIFRFDGSKAKGISVPKNTTHQELLDRVYSLLTLDRNEFNLTMNFIYASSMPIAPAEIVSDDDVSFFIGENSGEASLRTPLCITLVRINSDAQEIAYGETSRQTSEERPETLAEINNSDFRIGENEDARSLPGSTEWVTTEEAIAASSSSSSDHLETRQLFLSKKDLQEKLSLIAIKKNFEFRVQKSSKDVLVLSCIDENCQWRLRACKFRDNTSFQIRKYHKHHSCSTESRCKEHRQASSWVIGQHIKSKFGGSDRNFRPKDIIEEVRRDFGLSLSYEKAWRAREIALGLDGAPRQRRHTGWSCRNRKKQTELLPEGDRPVRKCRKCGEVGHYSKTCSNSTSSTSNNVTKDVVLEENVGDS